MGCDIDVTNVPILPPQPTPIQPAMLQPGDFDYTIDDPGFGDIVANDLDDLGTSNDGWDAEFLAVSTDLDSIIDDLDDMLSLLENLPGTSDAADTFDLSPMITANDADSSDIDAALTDIETQMGLTTQPAPNPPTPTPPSGGPSGYSGTPVDLGSYTIKFLSRNDLKEAVRLQFTPQEDPKATIVAYQMNSDEYNGNPIFELDVLPQNQVGLPAPYVIVIYANNWQFGTWHGQALIKTSEQDIYYTIEVMCKGVSTFP
jgi:hypothetical protein